MAFPIGAVIGGVLGVGSSIFGASEQRNAARQANAQAEKQAKQQYKRAKKEWEIDFLDKQANWMWDKARIAAVRYTERQKEADYNWRSQRLIESAMENLAVNTEALRDRFVVEEGLRAQQVGMEYGYTMNRLAAEAGESVRQYMAGIRDTALQSQQLVNQTEREGQELLTSLSFDMQKDGLQWDIAQIAALIDQSQTAATAGTRMGGSASSKRLALNKAQELGRTFGELDQRAKSREARMGLFNAVMQGETATQMGRMALSMQDQAEKIKYTNARYASDTAFETMKLQRLTIPSFELAAKQYGRELKSLQIQTQGVINEASMPYRQAIIFDPPEPIKGLKPEKYAPTKIYEPSTAGMIGGAILAGAQGAINFGSYTKSDGTLGWR